MLRFGWFAFAGMIALGAAGLAGACKDDPPHGSGGSAGGGETGGQGGCPTIVEQPLFTLRITARDATVPDDTTVAVNLTTRDPPPFVLSDPSSWGVFDTFECDVAGDEPPADLDELVCHVSTSSTIDVTVSAAGFESFAETLTPMQIDDCDLPVPREVAIELSPDTGTGGTTR